MSKDTIHGLSVIAKMCLAAGVVALLLGTGVYLVQPTGANLSYPVPDTLRQHIIMCSDSQWYRINLILSQSKH